MIGFLYIVIKIKQKEKNMIYIVKVISRFEFFLVTFAHKLVMGVEVVASEAEFYSASNGVLSRGVVDHICRR